MNRLFLHALFSLFLVSAFSFNLVAQHPEGEAADGNRTFKEIQQQKKERENARRAAELTSADDYSIPRFYSGIDLSGTYFSFSFSDSNLKDDKYNDKASSIIVPSGWQVVLYEHTDFGGKSFTVTGPDKIYDLSYQGFGNKVSSVKVFKIETTRTER